MECIEECIYRFEFGSPPSHQRDIKAIDDGYGVANNVFWSIFMATFSLHRDASLVCVWWVAFKSKIF